MASTALATITKILWMLMSFCFEHSTNKLIIHWKSTEVDLYVTYINVGNIQPSKNF